MKLTTISISLILLLLSINVVADNNLSGSFLTIDGQVDKLENYIGNITLVVAFATWCVHCQDEHSELNSIWNDYGNDINLISLGISSRDDLDTLHEFIEEYPTPWIIGLDTQMQFSSKFDISGVPTLLFFDEFGNFGSCFSGKQGYNVISQQLNHLLEDSASYVAKNSGSGICESSGSFSLNNIVFFSLLVALFVYTVYVVYSWKKK
jgi:thiol-disulfide isomerase/thioredoxin